MYMLSRPRSLDQLRTATRRSPVTALLGPRQCGKTTLARTLADEDGATYFDLESAADRRSLQNPELHLGQLQGLVIIDEIQVLPELFTTLRVLVDRPSVRARFLVLGSASPHIVKGIAETLAGRIEFVELSGFNLGETGEETWRELWCRGGFPRSFLAADDVDSVAWREEFVRTFLERDIPQLGIRIPAPAMRRFWTMLAHYHGQRWNASEIARAMGLSDKTTRSYLDILSGTFMVRQLQPWFENLQKRQVKAPKVYLRDSGILHTLLNLPDWRTLAGHPKVGASWEGFALEQFIQAIRPPEAYFWATHTGAELDLVIPWRGRKFGCEFKFNEAPTATRSMHAALTTLALEHLWVIHPGETSFPIHERITAWSINRLEDLPQQLSERS
jgi:predicted AAA+ superfamily ATPase